MRLAFKLPQGKQGEAATIAVGSVSTGETASVINSGTDSDAILDFVLPRGEQGLRGEQGEKGEKGDSATIEVGSVSAGETASVTNVGTNSAAVLNFVIPRGPEGKQGPKGEDGSDGDASSLIHIVTALPEDPLPGHLYIIPKEQSS